MYIKFHNWFILGEMFTAVLITFVTQTVAILFTCLYCLCPKRMPTVDAFCLGRAFEMEEAEFDYSIGTTGLNVPILFILLFGMFLVTSEIIIYLIIFVHLYKHDQGMRYGIVTVPERNIQRRVRTSTITLLGHFIGFVFDIVFLIIGLLTPFVKSKRAKFLLPNLSFGSPFGIQSLLQIVISLNLQVELANILDKLLFVPKITNILGLLNYFGLFHSFHSRLLAFRMRYL